MIYGYRARLKANFTGVPARLKASLKTRGDYYY